MSGFPDIDVVATYGGALTNYFQVEDATTDLDASADNQNRCSTAAMTHTASRAWARLVCAATTGALALSNVNPNDAGWPGLPTNAAPTLLRNGTGDFTLTWPATVQDELGATKTPNFRYAVVSIEGSTFAFHTESCPTANSVRVRLANTGGAANDFVGTTIAITVY